MASRRAVRRGWLNKLFSVLVSLSLVSGCMLPSAAFANENDTSSALTSAEEARIALAPGMAMR